MLAWCGSPSSMKTHLLGTHQINKAIAIKYQEEELKDLMQSDDIKPHDFAKQESLTKNVMGFIIGTVQPLSILEDTDFINMVNGFDERYKVPCTKTLKDRIFTVYEAGKDTLKSQFMQIQYISLTLDAWSSPAHLPYLGVTAHWLTSKFEPQEILLSMEELPYPHSAFEIQNHLFDLLYEWEINSKIIAITTDNGSNVIKANNTRWNSTLYAFQRLVLLKPAIQMLKASLSSDSSSYVRKEGEKLEELCPTVYEWKVIKEAIELLDPFEEATCLLSGIKY